MHCAQSRRRAPNFQTFFEHEAIAWAFDLVRVDGDDLQRLPQRARKLPHRSKDRHPVRAEDNGDEYFEAACKLGLEGIVSKRLSVEVRNRKSAAYLRISGGTF